MVIWFVNGMKTGKIPCTPTSRQQGNRGINVCENPCIAKDWRGISKDPWFREGIFGNPRMENQINSARFCRFVGSYVINPNVPIPTDKFVLDVGFDSHAPPPRNYNHNEPTLALNIHFPVGRALNLIWTLLSLGVKGIFLQPKLGTKLSWSNAELKQ